MPMIVPFIRSLVNCVCKCSWLANHSHASGRHYRAVFNGRGATV